MSSNVHEWPVAELGAAWARWLRVGLSWCADRCAIAWRKSGGGGRDVRAVNMKSAVDESVSFLAYSPGLANLPIQSPHENARRNPIERRSEWVVSCLLTPWDPVARYEEPYSK